LELTCSTSPPDHKPPPLDNSPVPCYSACPPSPAAPPSDAGQAHTPLSPAATPSAEEVEAATVHHHVCSPEDIFHDFHARRADIVKALTMGQLTSRALSLPPPSAFVLDFWMLELADTHCFCGDTQMWISSTSSVWVDSLHCFSHCLPIHYIHHSESQFLASP
jgi:hypothetical protein